MAETKGRKSLKGKRERNKAQQASPTGNSSSQAHRPKKRQKWGKPNKSMPSSIKDKDEQRGRKSKTRQS